MMYKACYSLGKSRRLCTKDPEGITCGKLLPWV